jgi:hypothetical protein
MMMHFLTGKKPWSVDVTGSYDHTLIEASGEHVSKEVSVSLSRRRFLFGAVVTIWSSHRIDIAMLENACLWRWPWFLAAQQSPVASVVARSQQILYLSGKFSKNTAVISTTSGQQPDPSRSTCHIDNVCGLKKSP